MTKPYDASRTDAVKATMFQVGVGFAVIESVREHRFTPEVGTEFLVKWADRDESLNSWIPLRETRKLKAVHDYIAKMNVQVQHPAKGKK
jgi:hypothetical protein